MSRNLVQVIIVLLAWLRCILPVTADDLLRPVIHNVAAGQLAEHLEKRNSLEKRDCNRNPPIKTPCRPELTPQQAW